MGKVISIEVAAADIATGEARHCTLCPVARAARRVIDAEPGQRLVVVRTGDLLIERQSPDDGSIREHSLRLPTFVAARIHTFDLTGRMEPFSFPLTLPDPVSAAAPEVARV